MTNKQNSHHDQSISALVNILPMLFNSLLANKAIFLCLFYVYLVILKNMFAIPF